MQLLASVRPTLGLGIVENHSCSIPWEHPLTASLQNEPAFPQGLSLNVFIPEGGTGGSAMLLDPQPWGAAGTWMQRDVPPRQDTGGARSPEGHVPRNSQLLQTGMVGRGFTSPQEPGTPTHQCGIHPGCLLTRRSIQTSDIP